MTQGLNLDKTAAQLVAVAGEELGELLEKAGRHFRGDKVQPRTEPLTDAEIDLLIDDDSAALESD